MTFTCKPYIKYLIAFPIIFGIILLFYVFKDLDAKSENQKEVLIWFIPLLLGFFFFLPIWTFRKLKKIAITNGQLLIDYPYSSQKIAVDKNDIDTIKVFKDVTVRTIHYDELIIWLKNGKRIRSNSLEIKDFDKLKNLLEQNFSELIEATDFWTGKK